MTWQSLLESGCEVREVDDRIYSVMPGGSEALYDDGRAWVYDLLVGSRLYNRLIWAARRDGYAEFAAAAVKSSENGPLLDAACGSMLFSVDAHRASSRLTVACDQSIEMLRRARRRLMQRGAFPEHVILLQADVTSLPFKASAFETVLCMNVLHHIEAGDGLITGLKRLLAPGGKLFLTSLVRADRGVGDGYMNLLHRRGEFATPRSPADIERMLGASFDVRLDGHMAYFTSGNRIPLP